MVAGIDLVRDPEMPVLERALDPGVVWDHLSGCLSGRGELLELTGIRVVRHKPGRRCLIEYEIKLDLPGDARETLTLLGKVRARGADGKSCRIQTALWQAGFRGENGRPGVPETLGVVPELHMWFQRKVAGKPSTGLLAGPGGTGVARRIAELDHALHQSGIPPLRRPHKMSDELRILHERLPQVAREYPHLGGRLRRVLDACVRLGAGVPESVPRGIHRDFYPDQVLVDGDRLWLLDLDLYCAGDPALDAGNFLAHLKERSLRTLGDPAALADREKAFEERFLQLSHTTSGEAIRAYTTLTLVRHIHISTLFEDRRPFTQTLLELCEERLGLVSR